MSKKIIYEAETEFLQILNEKGTADDDLLKEIDQSLWIKFYKEMLKMRRFDEKALNLQRQGRIGTYASLIGQEACQTGSAYAMDKDDWIVPSFREQGVMMARGLLGSNILNYWNGDERGSIFPKDFKSLPISIPVGSQVTHGAGLGYGFKLKGKKSVALTFVGDGGSSEGDFHEGLNFAGVFKAQTVFFVQNNQWAISVPFKKQTAAETVAQKAHAYGIKGIQVDGNDVFAVFYATKKALDVARNGNGPTLIEALTYRMENHTTADDASRYRPPEEIAFWKKKDPLERVRLLLLGRDLWDEKKENEFNNAITEQIERDIKVMESIPKPDPSDIFKYMYKEIPDYLRDQAKEIGVEL